jgi:hypothetical protein
MTEQEWQEAIDPRPMLRWLSSRIGAREAMRFAYSCCDRVRALIHDPRSVRALDVLQLAITEGVDRSVIHAVATEAQQAAWLAVRVFCVPILGEEEFNRPGRIRADGLRRPGIPRSRGCEACALVCVRSEQRQCRGRLSLRCRGNRSE